MLHSTISQILGHASDFQGPQTRSQAGGELKAGDGLGPAGHLECILDKPAKLTTGNYSLTIVVERTSFLTSFECHALGRATLTLLAVLTAQTDTSGVGIVLPIVIPVGHAKVRIGFPIPRCPLIAL